MTDSDWYKILQVSPTATAAEIKQAYRRLAKQAHPDRQTRNSDHGAIVRINAAYEVLGDPERRQIYDRQRHWENRAGRSGAVSYQSYSDYARASGEAQSRAAEAAESHGKKRRSGGSRASEVALEDWMKQIYNPVSRKINEIIRPLNTQINQLAADPFDDELMDAFVAYLETCRLNQEKAQDRFRSMPNPPLAAGPASKLYYAINHLSDGIDELERFTTSYEESYIHSGKEMFRRARQFRKEAQESLKQMGR